MLKCKIIRNKRIKVKALGTGHELTVELLALIQNMYRNIAKKNPEVGGMFKTQLIASLLDPESPVWAKEE